MNSNEFPAYMNKIAKKYELLIDKLIKKKQGKPITFGDKIKLLERRFTGIDTSLDTNKLLKDLKTFNKYWNITKHGSEVSGFPFNYFKSGKMTIFTSDLRLKITKEYEGNQKKLTTLLRLQN